MALRLRKDVQKASYYVWFLGAEEARGLRGPRVLLPAIPHLVERSREQEPLKVTLQVSQKGMKIVQGASKHFITHSAITCSVQTDDIVACVLLLYNPTTKCPLHVHAYRCDSETTAQALHQFLQVLINRPDNQKRFAELEARLGLQSLAISASSSPSSRSLSSPDVGVHPSAGAGKLALVDGGNNSAGKQPVRRFESSLGSDTGTSTRESECSDELVAAGGGGGGGSPAPPPKSSLFDSLAAELRAKLNGNGPPLLLPPRDYDTVHRSKGNLAATELRRCRNSLIVGDKMKKQQHQKQSATSRSRGSSGIGSDLAPSPERPIDHSSSDEEEWIPNAHLSVEPEVPPFQPRKPLQRQSSYPFNEHFDTELHADQQPPPSYLYPSTRDDDHHAKMPMQVIGSAYAASPAAATAVDKQRLARSSSREKSGASAGLRAASNNDEQDIRPIIIRPRTYDSRFKHVLDERKYTGGDADVDDDPLDQSYPAGDKLSASAAGASKPQLERKYRTAEEVLLKTSFGSRYDVDGVDHHQQQHHAASDMMTPPPMANYRYGEKARSTRTAGDERKHADQFDYRENLTDREKYRESQKYNQMHHGKDLQQFDEHHQHHPGQHDDYPLHEASAMRVRKSYAEPMLMGEKPASSPRREISAAAVAPLPLHKGKYGNEFVDADYRPINNSGRHGPQQHHHYRHREPEPQHSVVEPVKLSRSFKDKTAGAEYDTTVAAVRNPYKEPDSLPYRESIEKMLKSPVMRYKSFESHDAVAAQQHRDAAIRYHNLDEQQDSSQFHMQQQQPLPSRRRPQQQIPMTESHPHHHLHQHQQRAGSPDTVCRVSPKDRFNNAKEKFEAMERERNYAPAVAMPSTQSPLHHAQHQAMRLEHEHRHMQHQRSQSPQLQPPTRRTMGGHQLSQQQRYSMHAGDDIGHGKADWSSEDEPSSHQQHHQQQQRQQGHHHDHQPQTSPPLMMQQHSRRTPVNASSHSASGYRDGAGIPAPDPYGPGGGAMASAKSLGNLVRGYRHSYAEPQRHQTPLQRNSGRVGLAAVNPF